MRVGTGGGVARVTVAENITALWTFAHANGISLDDIIERTSAAGVTIDGQLIKDGKAVGYGKLAVAEVVTALWEFSNALGIRTDDIRERTGAAGVTIDGVLLKDGAIITLENAADTTEILLSSKSGDANIRFRQRANGEMRWGPGTGGLDTQLGREAAGELGTPDDFNIGGVLDLAGDIELTERLVSVVNGANDDVATGTVPTQRLTGPTAVFNITGFAGGRDGRLLFVYNVSLQIGTLNHQDGGSVAANRMILPNSASVTLSTNEGVIFRYSTTSSRWELFGTAI